MADQISAGEAVVYAGAGIGTTIAAIVAAPILLAVAGSLFDSDTWTHMTAQFSEAGTPIGVARDQLSALSVDSATVPNPAFSDPASWHLSNRVAGCRRAIAWIDNVTKHGAAVTDAQSTALSGMLDFCPHP